MTADDDSKNAEKKRKAEDKARRKAEVAERRAQRSAQLAALGPYWFFLRYNVNARSCSQDFFLFWARQLLRVAPYVFLALSNMLDYVRHLFFMVIFVAVLCLIFPPVLVLVELSIVVFIMGAIWVVTEALLFITGYLPILLAAVKRRINDVSPTSNVADVRFLLFIGTGIALLASVIVCAPSWIAIPAFTTGALSWMVSFGYVFMGGSLVLLVGQIHYYSVSSGVKGDNFAGTNPIETPLTEELLSAQGSQVASQLWRVLSLVLMLCAIVISLALSNGFIRALSAMSMLDPVLKLVSPSAIGIITYSIQGLLIVVALFFVCAKSRLKPGSLSEAELQLINACFKPRYTEIPDTLRNQVAQIEEKESKEGPGWFISLIGKVWFALKIFCSPMYYVFMYFTFYYGGRNLVFLVTIFVLLPAAAFAYFYFAALLEKGKSGTIDGKVVCSRSVSLVLRVVRAVALWPFIKSGRGTGEKVSLVAEQRAKVRNVALIDPLGLHNFVMGQYEIGTIQLLFCLTFVGIPIGWLWSVFDSIRFSRMSDDEFLKEYPDFCVSRGIVDKVMSLLSRISTALLAFLAFVVVIYLSIS